MFLIQCHFRTLMYLSKMYRSYSLVLSMNNQIILTCQQKLSDITFPTRLFMFNITRTIAEEQLISRVTGKL